MNKVEFQQYIEYLEINVDATGFTENYSLIISLYASYIAYVISTCNSYF